MKGRAGESEDTRHVEKSLETGKEENQYLAELVLQKHKIKSIPKIHRAQTDFIRLVSSKLMLWGASRRLGPPF